MGKKTRSNSTSSEPSDQDVLCSALSTSNKLKELICLSLDTGPELIRVSGCSVIMIVTQDGHVL